MQVLVVRHAIAMERSEWRETGLPDSERPLTETGRRRMKKAVAGLTTLLPALDVIATSPYERARKTAALLAAGYDDAELLVLPALASGGPRDDVLAWLLGRRSTEDVALVGHEPDLGRLVSWLLGGRAAPGLGMKKGGACLIHFAGVVRPGHGELLWFLGPTILRALGERR